MLTKRKHTLFDLTLCQIKSAFIVHTRARVRGRVMRGRHARTLGSFDDGSFRVSLELPFFLYSFFRP